MTFRQLTGSLHQTMTPTDNASVLFYITKVGCDWQISILANLGENYLLSSPQLLQSPVVFPDHWYPGTRETNLNK